MKFVITDLKINFQVSGFCFLLLGIFLWHYALVPKPLSRAYFGRPVVFVGRVVGIPKRNKLGVRFLLKTTLGKIQVSWYQHKKIPHADERWRFVLKLKAVHGFHNPGGFNVERWSRMRGIVASAYVLTFKEPELLSKPLFSIDVFRDRVQQAIYQGVASRYLSGVIAALSMGSKYRISPEVLWIFQQTGTSHLMAISGLHVGLVVLMIYFFVNRLVRFVPRLLLYWPAQRIACVASMLSAWGYGFLVGMSLPTQRAMIMVTVFSLFSLVSRPISVCARLIFSFFVVLAFQPLALFSSGFWLSFIAVFWLAYAAFVNKSWLRVKLVLSLGLLPISLYCFYQVSLISTLINMIAIPWISFFVVPFCLLASLVFPFSKLAAVWIWNIAADCFYPLLYLLEHFSHWSLTQWRHPINDFFILIMALFGVLLLFAPRGLPLRILSVALLLPFLIWMPERPKNNTAWLTVLDVGQGLATVIQTAHHLLVYDTGPRFPSGFDSGRSIVAPYLKMRGIRKIDILMVSHGDNDHIGGSFWLVQHFPVTSIFSSIDKSRWQHSFDPCYAGQHWSWDGVQFHVFWPPKNQDYQDNNSSCVLKITAGGQSILLTGDIERPAETALVSENVPLSAEVLVAPHHGSRSSSTFSFVRAVQPKMVILSLGYQNRYHFPAKSVVARYHALGAQILSTAKQGAITIALGIGERIRHNGRLIIS